MREVVKLIEKHVSERQIDRHQGLNVLCDFLIDMFDVRHYIVPYGFFRYCTILEKQDPHLFRISMIWMDKVACALEHGTWIDFFGGIYEEMYQSRGKASTLGQFFTPPAVCDIMSLCGGLTDKGIVNDNACGSGRTLLASHATSGYPDNVYYMADDIDTASVKMCALNMMSHGMRGRVARHDSLRDNINFDYGFEVNEVRYPYKTPFYSVRKINCLK